jgi:hypothetical protein
VSTTLIGRRQRAAGHQVDDLPLLLAGRVADLDHQHEAVDLGLGQRVGALLLDGVLRGHDHERVVQAVAGLADGDLALLHGLEER